MFRDWSDTQRASAHCSEKCLHHAVIGGMAALCPRPIRRICSPAWGAHSGRALPREFPGPSMVGGMSARCLEALPAPCSETVRRHVRALNESALIEENGHTAFGTRSETEKVSARRSKKCPRRAVIGGVAGRFLRPPRRRRPLPSGARSVGTLRGEMSAPPIIGEMPAARRDCVRRGSRALFAQTVCAIFQNCSEKCLHCQG